MRKKNLKDKINLSKNPARIRKAHEAFEQEAKLFLNKEILVLKEELFQSKKEILRLERLLHNETDRTHKRIDKEREERKESEAMQKVRELENKIKVQEEIARLERKMETSLLELEKRIMKEVDKNKDAIRDVRDLVMDIKLKTGQEVLRLDAKIDKVIDTTGLSFEKVYIAIKSGLFDVKQLIAVSEYSLKRDIDTIAKQIIEDRAAAKVSANETKISIERVNNALNAFQLVNEVEHKKLAIEARELVRENDERNQRRFEQLQENIRAFEKEAMKIYERMGQFELALEKINLRVDKVGIENEKIKREAVMLIKDIMHAQDMLHNNILMAEYNAEAIGHRISEKILREMYRNKELLQESKLKMLELNFAGKENALKAEQERLKVEKSKSELAQLNKENEKILKELEGVDFNLYGALQEKKMELRDSKKQYDEARAAMDWMEEDKMRHQEKVAEYAKKAGDNPDTVLDRLWADHQIEIMKNKERYKRKR